MWRSLVVAQLVCIVFAHGDIGFPDNESVDIERNKTRTPLYIPGKCKDNQLLYPGDKPTDWVCDCRPGYVFYPPDEKCFEVYRRGPCPDKHHLILPETTVIPLCVRNECETDGKVMYNGTCYELNKTGPPCKSVEAGGGVFGVNSTTLKLDCLIGTDRLSFIVIPPNRQPCEAGYVHDARGICRKAINQTVT